jgi:hypothetical protein
MQFNDIKYFQLEVILCIAQYILPFMGSPSGVHVKTVD